MKCEADDDGGGRRYIVRHKHGKVIVLGTLAGFDDFVVQLKRLNPNVNIPEQRTALSLAGEAFFVVSVLAMVALIAIRTLGG